MGVRRGCFVVFEGLDRCGKSTQSELLNKTLIGLGLKTMLLKFPDRKTPTGSLIHQYLTRQIDMNAHSVHLLFSSNRWEKADIIKDNIKAGITVISDRYAYSGFAYTAAKPEVCKEWCRHPDSGLPQPDIVFFLSQNPDVFSDRSDYGAERYEIVDFQQKVLSNFIELNGQQSNFVVIDANRSIEDIHDFVYTNVKKRLKLLKSDELDELKL